MALWTARAPSICPEVDGKTLLTYGGDAQIGGMLASVGQRLIEGASKQMINQSLKALTEQITLRANGGPAEPADARRRPPSLPPPPSLWLKRRAAACG